MKDRLLPRKGIKGTIIQHLLFWLVSISLFVILIFYMRDFSLKALDFATAVNILITLAFLAISVYINLLWLIPSFFNHRRYFLFSVFQVLNIMLFIFLNYFVSMAFEGPRKNYIQEVVAELILVLIFLVITTLIKFTRDSIALQEAELKIKEVEREKVESDLKTLRAQVNPHFFFNTLNSLYSLSLDKSEKTPEMILKLSELMRHVLYETGDDKVPMDKHLDFLRSYIYLEKLRSEESLKVDMEISGDHAETLVAPLLFVPFVENAFKHGPKNAGQNPFIRIRFNLEHEGEVSFTVENNKDDHPLTGVRMPEGIGISNVKRRLELLYPGMHTLTISDLPEVYRVDLTIRTI
jgi:two-component system, LytTR family, sensor kinase